MLPPPGKVVHLDQWRKRLMKKRSPVAPVTPEPKTGEHQIVPLPGIKHRHKPVGPTKVQVKAMLRQSEISLTAAFKMRVLNQYVRHVIGRDGVEEYLLAATKHRQRWSDKRDRVPLTFERAWAEQLQMLVTRARAFVNTADQTGESTRRGYLILRGTGASRKPVFITLHHVQDVVVGIYSSKQFTKKRANRRDRAESHRQAVAFRKSKASLTPR